MRLWLLWTGSYNPPRIITWSSGAGVLTLPYQTEIIDCGPNQPVPARIVLLDEQLADTAIDVAWWDGFSHNERQQQEDSQWNWAEFARWFGGKPEYSCIALLVNSGYCQGAMVLHLDSHLASGDQSVKVERLATAPNSRRSANLRQYRGCGESLIAYASAVSLSLNRQGTLTLSALENAVAFYEGIGFTNTGLKEGELPILELGCDAALEYLRFWKVVP